MLIDFVVHFCVRNWIVIVSVMKSFVPHMLTHVVRVVSHPALKLQDMIPISSNINILKNTSNTCEVGFARVIKKAEETYKKLANVPGIHKSSWRK